MTQEIQQAHTIDEIPQDVIESLVLNNDLSKMTNPQRVDYYNSFCRLLKLNPLTQPFQILNLKGKVVMYARKDATDQLRKIYGVSVTEIIKEQIGDTYMVTVKGSDRTGRTDMAVGAVSLTGKAGEDLANQIMKAETKAKRRFTLSICGLGVLDETEVESIQQVENQQNPNHVSLDVINPKDAKAVEKYEQMLSAISNPIVPEELFGGQSKQDFVNDFHQNLMDGTLSISFAEKVFSSVLACFQNQS